MDFNSILENLGFQQKLSLDISLLIIIAIITFIWGIVFGRGKLAPIFSGIYISIVITSAVSFDFFDNYIYRLILFFILVAIFVFWENKFFNSSFASVGYGFSWKVFVMSFFEIMLILSYVLTIIPHKIAANYVSVNAFGYVASQDFRLIWMVIPFIFLAFANRKSGRY